MAPTGPNTNIAVYVAAASLVGRVMAGIKQNKASGLQPYTTPVAKMPRL